jgi:hypothetical protein
MEHLYAVFISLFFHANPTPQTRRSCKPNTTSTPGQE